MSEHRHLDFFERHGDQLALTCPYAVDVIQAAPGIDNRNSLPWSRLFLMDAGVPDGRDPNFVTDIAARRRHPLVPGQVLFLPPDRLYGFRFSPGMRMIALHFRLEWAVGCDVFSGRSACETLAQHRDLIRSAYLALRRPDHISNVASLRGILMQLAGSCIREVPKIAPRLQAVLAHIEHHCQADCTIDALAIIAELSREHFTREFKRQVGIPPMEHVHRRLVQHACSSLLAGKKVKEVADNLGFTNEFYFSRFFKRRTGIAPRAFAASI